MWESAVLKMVVYPPLDAARTERLRAAADPMMISVCETDAAAVSAIADADAFFGKLTEPMLAAARKLRWVQSPTASLEHYLFPALIEHPCTVTNMRGLFSDVIADHVLGYILMFARNLHVYLRQQQQRIWAPVGGESARSTFAAGPGQVSAMDRAHLHLADCTLGIVGLGHIGGEIARRGASFGMRTLAVDPTPREASAVDEVWGLNRLDDLLASSDFVVIAAPHTPDTAGMFGTPQFRAMRRSAYLINIGRGVIVKLDELDAALESKLIAGAALDVFETEPLPASHPLWGRENVLITPHVAACSVRIAERHLAVLLDNAERFAAGNKLRNVVNKRAWY